VKGDTEAEANGVGNHYNPQRLLRNFQIPDQPGFIWQHDKQRDEPIRAAVKHVAQERDFYDPETEKQLNTEVEVPGGNAIDKILAKQPLTSNEQIDLALHTGTMLRRTPARRLWAKDISKVIMPQAIELVRAHGHAAIQESAAANQRSEEWVNAWLEQMEKSIEKLNGKPCEEAVERMNDPFPSPRIIAALLSMTWRIAESTGPQTFITSDNPAVYFRAEGYGLGGNETEVIMPISPFLTLHGSRNVRHHSFTRLKVRQKIVREFNKRIVRDATRFVFTHDRAPWLARILKRDDLGLMRVGW
jgi:Protein of unknown function (DUF4238)